MPVDDFSSGLLTGLTQGYASQILHQQQLEDQEKQNQARVVSQLIAAGDFESVKYIDPKIKKSLGFTPELDQHLDQMILLQQDARAAKIEKAQQDVKVGRFALSEAESRQNQLSTMTPEEQKQARFPGIVESQKFTQEKTLREQQLRLNEKELGLKEKQITQEGRLKSKQLELTEQQIANAHADRQMADQTRVMQIEAYTQASQDRLEQAKLLAKDRENKAEVEKEIKETNQKIKIQDSARRGFEAAQKSLDSLTIKLGQKDPKTDAVSLTYTNQVQAEQVAKQLNNAQKIVNSRGKVLNDAYEDQGLYQPMEWAAVKTKDKFMPIFGSDNWTVMPVEPGAAGQTAMTPQAAAEKKTTAPPRNQHKFQDILDSASQQQQPENTLSLPQNKKGATQMMNDVLTAQSIATKDPEGAKALLKSHMAPEAVNNLVENNLFDALIQALSVHIKKTR